MPKPLVRKITKIGPIQGEVLELVRSAKGEPYGHLLRFVTIDCELHDFTFHITANNRIEVLKGRGDKFSVKSQVIVQETF